MAKPESIYLYIGTYPDQMAAQEDYALVKALHDLDYLGTYDAAVVTKDEKGKVHVNKDEMATRHAGWGGAAAGAVLGILFPPTIIGSALVGGGIGAAAGHLWRGLSRSDVRELGELIDEGEAALLVVGTAGLQDALTKAKLRPQQSAGKQVDVDSDDFDRAVKAAASEVS